MAAYRKILRWLLDHVLWDSTGYVGEGFWGAIWPGRKLVVAVAGSAVLTWWEWEKHHPPEIAIIAFIHFLFVLAAIALLVYLRQRRGQLR